MLQSRDISIRHFQKRCGEFLPPLCTLSTGKPDAGNAFGQSKAGQISKNRNKQTSDQELEKKLRSSRKKRNKSCLCFDTLFIKSFNITFNVTSLKNGHIFFVCFWEFIFSSHESKSRWTVHREELIITLSEFVKNRAELSRMLNIPRTTITSVLSTELAQLGERQKCFK